MLRSETPPPATQIRQSAEVTSTAVPSSVWITDHGAGTLEGCDLFANAQPGVEVKQGRNPPFRVCRTNRNGPQAFCAVDGGVATVEDCDLTCNPGGAGSRYRPRINKKSRCLTASL